MVEAKSVDCDVEQMHNNAGVLMCGKKKKFGKKWLLFTTGRLRKRNGGLPHGFLYTTRKKVVKILKIVVRIHDNSMLISDLVFFLSSMREAVVIEDVIIDLM